MRLQELDDWLVVPKPNAAAETRLLCMPNAGAGMLMYQRWAAALPWAEVVLAHLPGRDGRRQEAVPPSIQDVAAPLARAIAAQRGRPWALFGHSMGALIGYEVARVLERDGGAVAALIVSGRRAPTCPEPFAPLASLPLSAFGAAAQARYGGIPDVVLQDPELADLVLPLLRADLALVESYRRSAGGPLHCPLFVYAGTEDPHTTPEDLAAWQEETTGEHAVRMFPGGHFYLDTCRDLVLDALTADVQRLR